MYALRTVELTGTSRRKALRSSLVENAFSSLLRRVTSSTFTERSRRTTPCTQNRVCSRRHTPLGNRKSVEEGEARYVESAAHRPEAIFIVALNSMRRGELYARYFARFASNSGNMFAAVDPHIHIRDIFPTGNFFRRPSRFRATCEFLQSNISVNEIFATNVNCSSLTQVV